MTFNTFDDTPDNADYGEWLLRTTVTFLQGATIQTASQITKSVAAPVFVLDENLLLALGVDGVDNLVAADIEELPEPPDVAILLTASAGLATAAMFGRGRGRG